MLASWRVAGASLSASIRLLSRLIDLGEIAHARRDAEALDAIATAMLNLPLGGLGESIAAYYRALSLCRRGAGSWDEAKDVLCEVDGRAPVLFQAKALATRAVSVIAWEGDTQDGLALHREAARLAESCGWAGAAILLHAGNSRVFLACSEGMHKHALDEIERLRPLAVSIAAECPHVFGIYQNNLAALLVNNGRIDEARAVADALRKSSLIDAYPEWGRTCASVDDTTREASKIIVVIGEPFAAPNPGSGAGPTATTEHRHAESAVAYAYFSIAVPAPESEPTTLVGELERAPALVAPITSVAVAIRPRRWRFRRQYFFSTFIEYTRKPLPTALARAIRLDRGCRPLGWVYAQFPPTRAP